MKSFSVIALTSALLFAAPAIATAQESSESCSVAGFGISTEELLLAIEAAETAVVTRLEGCTGTPDAAVLDALLANEAIAKVLEQETVSPGEITAVGSDNGSVLIYTPDEAV